MGFLGLFIGPVLMAIIVAIWREWIREVELAEDEQEYNDAEQPLRIHRDVPKADLDASAVR